MCTQENTMYYFDQTIIHINEYEEEEKKTKKLDAYQLDLG